MSAPPRPSAATRTPGARTSRPASRSTARRSRLVEEPTPAEPRPARLSDIVAGIVSAGQALVLSLAVVVLPAVVAYLVGTATLATPTGAPDDDAQVGSAVDVAMGIWLLSHGVPLTADAVTVTLAPLGVATLALFATYVSAKRFATTTVRAWAAGAVTYALGTTAVAAMAGTAPGWSLPTAALAGLVMGGAGMLLGILARPDAPTLVELGERAEVVTRRLTGIDLVPATLRLGLRGGAVAVALLIGGAALLVAGWALAGRATSSDIITALEPGWTGGIVFAVAQLALLPNLVLWAAAWLAGPGFAVGVGTSFTPFGTISGPLPAIPLLGALPGDDWANPVSAWTPVLVVACGVAAGLFTWRRLEPTLVRWSDVGWVLCGIVVTPGVVMLLGQWAAAGAGGPGRLSDVGANPLATAGLVAAEVGGGAAAVLLGAKLDVVSRRGIIGEDLTAWLRRPEPERPDAEQAPDEPRGPAPEVPDLAAELGLDQAADASDAEPSGAPGADPAVAPAPGPAHDPPGEARGTGPGK
ncbi:DUF6350 family protein [Promicromonospora vindobonensis]|uniref:DUF6350 family protein n=1 Tax=Promicromonospora vindobonensis TaxID=195748 RepID=A0ABW5W3N3_9MICO